MKIFIKIDRRSIPQPTLNSMLGASNCLAPIAHDVFVFEFSPLAFTHAQELLSPETYGRDLATYLPSIVDHLKRADPNRELSLGFGDRDFKRRMSENLGVGIAALFMNQTLGMEWKSVTQVPYNKKMALNTPDFQGFDAGGKRYFFEAKGTTTTSHLEKQIAKGIRQVKNYPGAAQSKFVIATYLSGENAHFPSTGFVLDPPIERGGIENSEQAFFLHQRNTLRFFGLSEQSDAFSSILASDAAIVGTVSSAARKKHLRLRAKFAEELGTQLSNLKSENHYGRTYLCVEEHIATNTFSFHTRRGMLSELYHGLIGYNINQEILAGVESKATDESSVFDDGTFFSITAFANQDLDTLIGQNKERKADKSTR